jgi:hypothetical protein
MKTLHVAGKSIRKYIRKNANLEQVNARGFLVFFLLATLTIDGLLFYYSVGFQVGMRVNDGLYISEVYPGQPMTPAVHCAWAGARSGASGVGLLLYELGCRVTIK